MAFLRQPGIDVERPGVGIIRTGAEQALRIDFAAIGARRGLEDFFRDQTKLPVRIAEEPKYAIVRGLEQMFDEPLWLRRVMRGETHAMLELESESP